MDIINSYSSLKQSVVEWIANDEISNSVGTFIQNVEARLYRNPKNWGAWMETTVTQVIASSVIPVPADYLGTKHVSVVGQRARMESVSIDQLYGRYPRDGTTGFPGWMSREGSSFVFGPAPDSAYSIKLVYYAKPVFVGVAPADAVAHWMILNCSDLLLYGALMEASPFMKKDERVGTFNQFYTTGLKDYRDLIRREDTFMSQEVLG